MSFEVLNWQNEFLKRENFIQHQKNGVKIWRIWEQLQFTVKLIKKIQKLKSTNIEIKGFKNLIIVDIDLSF